MNCKKFYTYNTAGGARHSPYFL